MREPVRPIWRGYLFREGVETHISVGGVIQDVEPGDEFFLEIDERTGLPQRFEVLEVSFVSQDRSEMDLRLRPIKGFYRALRWIKKIVRNMLGVIGSQRRSPSEHK